MRRRTKRKIIGTILTVVMLIGIMPELPQEGTRMVQAEEVDHGQCGDDVYWSLDSDGLLTVSGSGEMWEYYYLGGEEKWTGVPSDSYVKEIVIEDGVTTIGYHAFVGLKDLVRVSIPESVTVIGAWAFVNCSNLEEVVLPSSIETIEEDAFRECAKLSLQELPAQLKKIGSFVFLGCDLIQSITVPKNVEDMNAFAFDGMGKLENIYVDEENAYYASYDGCLYNKDRTEWLACPAGKKSVTVASTTKKMYGAASGSYGYSLEEVVLEEGITEVAGDRIEWGNGESSYTLSVFGNCQNLKSVFIPKSVVSVDENAFLDPKWYEAGNNVIIKGYRNTSAQYYAQEKGFSFEALDEQQLFFDPNGGSVGTTSKRVEQGSTYGTLPVPEREGYVFAGWYTLADGGTKIEETWVVETAENLTLYAHWTVRESDVETQPGNTQPQTTGTTKTTATITYIGNGGTSRKSFESKKIGEKIGTLPKAERKKYEFVGWFTAAQGGIQISNRQIVAEDMVLYAHWNTLKMPKNTKGFTMTRKGKKLTVQINAHVRNAKGYEIVFATDSKFKKNVSKVRTVSLKKIVKSLKAGETYYVKVHAYTRDSAGKYFYGGFSSVKKIKM